MNFEDLKSALENEERAPMVPASLSVLKKSEMPMQIIKKRMKSEIATQLLCILVFFAIPFFIKLHELNRAVYFIFMFLASLMTLFYLIKMTWFLQKTNSVQSTSKDTIVTFVHDIQLTLEVYKTAIIAGSVLLPIAMMALFLGVKVIDESVFRKLFLLEISPIIIILLIFGYILTALFFYVITVKWADLLYGKHIVNLKLVLEALN